ncbi:hypothetical protein LA20533_05130 [Amylolactobacillus amylophilus DSM 20533 = JCM 1125]|uniref:Uncharacterized protein n=1 Tax=Amylolactobacillus amylophilus DSM 20533 = JCM 1125 TaxID=1423721 RepID=A0A1L6XCI9_9LACO|nr:hypothetical protein LA20533_05130 [Amylolactobacillus amylophilus DSM 20533 = JCM 1125]GED80770.1 hypothetical protein LAM01_12430 [Amylolactobacillus amylophilus]
MNKAKKQRTWGLIGLYICLLIISSLIQQIAYLGLIAVVLLKRNNISSTILKAMTLVATNGSNSIVVILFASN